MKQANKLRLPSGVTGTWISRLSAVNMKVSLFFAVLFMCATSSSSWAAAPVITSSPVTVATEGSPYSYTVTTSDADGDAVTLATTTKPDWLTVPGGEVLLQTDFSGRTVSGKTASNISWTTNGIADPGPLTAVDAVLFNSANTQGHFAPDRNVDNEGPWSVAIPIQLNVPEVTLENVVFDWQHFSNAGAFQTQSRSVNWTGTVAGDNSGQVSTETALNVSGMSGSQTLTFAIPLVLTNSENWTFTLTAQGTTGGNNTGLDAIAIYGIGNIASDYVLSGTPASDDVGDHLVILKATDPGGLATTQEFTIAVDNFNFAPVNTVPGPQAVAEDTALAITDLSVNDVDGNLATTQLSVTKGTLTVSLAGDATISAGANSTSTLTLSGTQTQINAALATVSYQGNLNVNGDDTLTMLSTDSAGTPLTDTDTVAITVTGTNDPPVAIAATHSVTEDGAIITGQLFSPDVDNNATASYSLDPPVAGLTIDADGSYSFDPGDEG
jgi:hypothetical protein